MAECHEDMGSDPCGKPAVGERVDPNHGGTYPVCSEHLAQHSPDEIAQLIEYGRRLEAEIPKLVRQGVERGRKVNAPADRIVEGILAHSGSLPSFRAALEDARAALAAADQDSRLLDLVEEVALGNSEYDDLSERAVQLLEDLKRKETPTPNQAAPEVSE